MNKKIISLIVPTFNMEKYLGRCLDSINNPEILSKVQVIIVNDGSTDRSLEIAQVYESHYPNSFIIINKPNGHYGSCINEGLKHAAGKYFFILEPDDWFDKKEFLSFIQSIETIDVDMILTKFWTEKQNGKKHTTNKLKEIVPNIHYDFQNIDYHSTNLLSILKTHGIIYKTELLKAMSYKQTEGVCYTDTEYCVYPLQYVKKIIYSDYIFYQYCIGREEQSVSNISMQKNKSHFFVVINKILNYFVLSSKDTATSVREIQYGIITWLLRSYYLIILCTDKNDIDDEKLKNIDNLIKKIDLKLYEKVGDFKCYKVKFIKLWRNSGMYIPESKLTFFWVRLMNWFYN